jgi:hypothetical protein
MGKPKPEDPKYKEFYDKIIAAAKGRPVDLEEVTDRIVVCARVRARSRSSSI